MIASVALTKSAAPKLDQLVLINPDQINNELMKECLDILQPVYEKLGANDKISKGAELLVALRQDIAKRYPHSLEA